MPKEGRARLPTWFKGLDVLVLAGGRADVVILVCVSSSTSAPRVWKRSLSREGKDF